MKSWFMLAGLALCVLGGSEIKAQDPPTLHVGQAEVDISPELGKRPVYLAGFGKNRKATAIHDPLMARAIVLADGSKKVALVSVDLIGLFLESVERVRRELAGFDYVLVSSTHNHEGPDTLGLWGPTFFQTGLDPLYLRTVEQGILEAVRKAEKRLQVVTAEISQTQVPELLHDGRQPIVLHDDLVVLRFRDAQRKVVGVVVQWNCHPETLNDKNTQASADFVGYTVKALAKKHACPVTYFTGTVGGLMTSLHVSVKNDKGESLNDGTYEKTERYGILLAEACDRGSFGPIRLAPFHVKTSSVYLPLQNKLYDTGWRIGVLDRTAYTQLPNETAMKPLPNRKPEPGTKLWMRTELGYLRFGELEVAAIPGEIYPELVVGKIQDPVDPGADFPNAPREPSIYGNFTKKYRMLIGLANDEIGYIIPKRQWDEKAPYSYGRTQSQYGEINSIGPEAAPILCEAFLKLVGKK